MKSKFYTFFYSLLIFLGLSACQSPKSLVLSPSIHQPDKDGFIMQRSEQQTVYTRYMEYSDDFIVFDAEFINQSEDSVLLCVDSFRYEVANIFGDSAQWVNVGIKEPNQLSKYLRQKVRNARIGQALLIVGAVALEVAAASAEQKSLRNSSGGGERERLAVWYADNRFDRINAMINIIGSNAHRIDYLNLDWKFYDKHLIRNQRIAPNGRVVGLIAVPRFDQAKKVKLVYKMDEKAYPFEYYQYFR